jgi:hypothetical protein
MGLGSVPSHSRRDDRIMWWLLIVPLAFFMQWGITIETNLGRAEDGFERRTLRLFQFMLILIPLLIATVL